MVPSERPIRTKDTLLNSAKHPRVLLGGKTNLPRPIANGPTYTGPITYFATMYDLTGNKVGNAFVGKTGNQDVVVVRPLLGSEKSKKKRRNRVFVGKLQASWGFRPDVPLADLEPISTKDKSNGPNERTYIGNKAMLFKPLGDYLDYEGWDERCSSPLTSLAEHDNEGDSRQWPFALKSDTGIVAQEDLNLFMERGPGLGFCADSLGEMDVTRAITLALTTCGVSVQLS